MRDDIQEEKMTSQKLADEWRSELSARENILNERLKEVERREQDVHAKEDDIAGREIELQRLDAVAIDNEIRDSELTVRSKRLHQEMREHEERKQDWEKMQHEREIATQARADELVPIFSSP